MTPPLRAYLTIAAAFVLSTAFTQPRLENVTITTGARPVSEVVEALSKASGHPMSVRGLAQHDIVMVSLKDVPASIAAQKLAQATGSHWVEEGGVSILTRSASAERAQWQKDAKVRGEAILAFFAQGSDEIKTQMGGQALWEIQPDLIGTIAASDVVRLIPPSDIAGLQFGERVVYSSRKTPMQRPLPSGTINVIRGYVAEQLAYYRAIQRRFVGAGQDNQALNNEFNRLIRDLESVSIGKILLVVHNQGGSILGVRLDILDADYELITSGQITIRLGVQDPPFGTTPPSTPLPYSARCRALADLWRRSRNGSLDSTAMTAAAKAVEPNLALDSQPLEKGRIAEPVSRVMSAFISRPDANEPIDYFTAELLRLAAEAENANVIACIPDSAMLPASLAISSNYGAKRFWNEISALQMTAKLEDGIYVVSPLFPSLSRYQRLNRTAFAELAASTGKGYASLDDFGRYAANTSRGAFSDDLDLRLMAIVHPETSITLRQNHLNQEALAIYASLGETRRRNMMESGGTVPVSTIGVIDAASWLTYNSTDGPQSQEPNRQANSRISLGAQIGASTNSVMGTGISNGQYRERTEFFPNGLPTEATISMRGAEQPILRAAENQGPSQRAGILTPEALGELRAKRDTPAYIDSRSTSPDFRVFTVGEQGTYWITIHYPGKHAMSRMLSEPVLIQTPSPRRTPTSPSESANESKTLIKTRTSGSSTLASAAMGAAKPGRRRRPSVRGAQSAFSV